MVYLLFPTNLTEEELMLQAKYQKLKKKKKALQALKAPRPEPERVIPTAKRPSEGRDAREVARKLLKSGAITAIAKTPKRPEQAGFKRPLGFEKKVASERTISGYQPFSTSQSDEGTEIERPQVKNLYESFVSARDKEERGLNEKNEKPDKPRQGNTIFVQGHSISEDLLRKAFSNCGDILNISMEIEKHRGFVTFKTEESAERAISEIHGGMVAGVQLKVSLARRQPQISPINNEASSAVAWSCIAVNQSHKGGHTDKRGLLVYDDNVFD